MKNFLFALTVFASSLAGAQSLNGTLLRLAPSTLPTKCRLGDLRVNTSNSSLELCNGSNSWNAFSTSGATVTSVGLSDGSTSPIFTVTNSPVTTSGTLTETLRTQNANIVFSGPSTGSAAQPTFRSLVAADVPTLNQNTTGTAGGLSATLVAASGGTGATSFTAFSPVIAGTTSTGAFQSASSGLSTVGAVLTSTGSGSVPTWQPPGSPTFSGLTQYALTYASTATTVTSLSSAGSAGQYYMSNGSSGVGGFTYPPGAVQSETSNYNIATTDGTILCSGSSFTVTLPTAIGTQGKQYLIKHLGTSLTQAYTINTTSAQTVGGIGSGSFILQTNQEYVLVESDNSNWQIVGRFAQTPWASLTNKVTATGAYTFTISATSVTAGWQYTNNGQTFTVSASSSGTTVTASGTGAPTSTGTLTCSIGCGSSLTYSASTSTGAPVFATSPSVNLFWWRRNGTDMQYRIEYAQSSNSGATGGSGDYVWFLPTGATMNTSAFTGNTIAGWTAGTVNNLGNVIVAVGAPQSVIGFVSAYSNNGLRFYGGVNSGSTNPLPIGGSSNGFSANNITVYSANGSIPMSGWQP